MEPCRLHSNLLRDALPPGIHAGEAQPRTRQEGSVHSAGMLNRTYLPPRTHSSLQLLAAFLQAAGNVIPLYYQTTYSVYVLGLTPATASMLLAVNNAVNSLARAGMGLMADYVGRQNTMIGCVRFAFPSPSIYRRPTLLSFPFAGHLLCHYSVRVLVRRLIYPFPRFRSALRHVLWRLQLPFAYYYSGNLWERALLFRQRRHLLHTWPRFVIGSTRRGSIARHSTTEWPAKKIVSPADEEI